MRRAIIFANGQLNLPPDFNTLLESTSLIVAADGGLANCKIAGIQPHVLIGDFDSIQPNEVSDYQSLGIEIFQHPTHKDETDLELALQFVTQKEYDEVFILGALGERWDMTIANILLLTNPKYIQVDIHILDGYQELILLKPGIERDMSGQPGMTLSLIPVNGDAIGITTRGLEYSLQDETLLIGATRGISNVFTDTSAHVSLTKGLLLCVLDHHQTI